MVTEVQTFNAKQNGNTFEIKHLSGSIHAYVVFGRDSEGRCLNKANAIFCGDTLPDCFKHIVENY